MMMMKTALVCVISLLLCIRASSEFISYDQKKNLVENFFIENYCFCTNKYKLQL